MSGVDPGAHPLALLVARIRKLYYVEAGQPSYPMLARVAEGVIAETNEGREWLRHLPRATACDLVGGKYKKAPDWLLVRTLVVVCHRIATKSDLDITPLDDLLKEFSRLWKAVKEGDETVSPTVHAHVELHAERGEPSPDNEIVGDVLAPLSGESPARRAVPTELHMPDSWGRLGERRLKNAEAGDAQAAYEMAVLLACEAAGKGDSDAEQDEAMRWKGMAAYWRGRAIGKVTKAAELRLQGFQLVNAARALAIEYKRAGRAGSMDFFRAVTQAEGAVQGLKLAPTTNIRAEELVITKDRGE